MTASRARATRGHTAAGGFTGAERERRYGDDDRLESDLAAALDLTRASVCPDGTRLDPPYHLAVDAVTGQIFAGRVDGGARVMRVLSVPVTLALDARTGRVTVSCATSEVFAPWDGP